jgi:nucleoid-associated protein YgaU
LGKDIAAPNQRGEDGMDDDLERRLGDERDVRDERGEREAPSPKSKAEHTVSEGETLSAISMKYYNSADRDDWMAIYEANKEVIGDNPNLIKPGQVLTIPER